jgi:hypothetical protein
MQTLMNDQPQRNIRSLLFVSRRYLPDWLRRDASFFTGRCRFADQQVLIQPHVGVHCFGCGQWLWRLRRLGLRNLLDMKKRQFGALKRERLAVFAVVADDVDCAANTASAMYTDTSAANTDTSAADTC